MSVHLRRIGLSITAALTVALSNPAVASTLLGVSNVVSTPIYTLNQTTGAASAGASTGLTLDDLASDAATGRLWGVSRASNRLYEINAATGQTLSNVALTSAAPIGALAFDPIGKSLFAISESNASGPNNATLLKIDAVTGATTAIGSFNRYSIFGMAFDSVGKLFFVADDLAAFRALYRIDTATAAHTLVGGLSAMSGDIAFRPEDGALFASAFDSNLYTVNPLTAAMTLVGALGTSQSGLAFIATVPEPSTWALTLAGIGLLACTARRKAR